MTEETQIHHIVTFLNENGESDWKVVNDEYTPEDGETLHQLQPEEVIGVIGSHSDNFIVVANDDPTKLPSVQEVDS